MTHTPRRLIISLGLALFGFVAAALAAEPRTWTDSTGKSKLVAKFVASDGGKVTLEKADGTRLQIELKRLSAADQKHVADIAKGEDDNPFKPVEDNPFKPAEGDPKAKGGSEPKLTEPDYSAAVVVPLAPVNPEWKLTVAPASAAELPIKPIGLPPKTSFWDKVNGAAVSPSTGRVAVSYVWEDRAKPEGGTTRLVMNELAGGKKPAISTMPGAYELLGLSEAGDTVLMKKTEWGHGKNDRLELWKVGAGAAKLAKWQPYGDAKGGDRDVRWASFAANKTVVTCNSAGKIIVWEIEGLKPKFSLAAQGGVVPGLSPDGKLLAFTAGKDVAVFDVVKGEVVCSRALPEGHFAWPQMSFSPSGKKLGCLSVTKFVVWDAATGAFEREVEAPHVMNISPVAWATDEIVLIAGKTLIDTASGLNVWNFDGVEAWVAAAGKIWFIATNGDKQPGGVIPAKLPHPAAIAALEAAKADKNYFALRPGAEVRLDVSGIEDEAQRSAVVKSLTSRAEKLGWTVSDTAGVSLVASTHKGKLETLLVGSGGSPRFGPFGGKFDFGGPFGPPGFPGRPGMPAEKGTQYQVQEYLTDLKVVAGGKEIWKHQQSSIPPVGTPITRGQDQTVADFFKQNWEKPNYNFFANAPLPKLLTRDAGKSVLGTSKVTPAGLK